MKAIQTEEIDIQKLDKLSELMRALAHPLRLRMIEFIDDQKSVNVNKIYKSLEIEQSIASQHLSILRNANVVFAKREGKFVFYKVNYPLVISVNETFQEYFKNH